MDISLNISTDISINCLTNISEYRATKAWREVRESLRRETLLAEGSRLNFCEIFLEVFIKHYKYFRKISINIFKGYFYQYEDI